MVLGDVAIFMRVVELRSLTAAARSLRMSVASASVRLKQLEEHVGARLLNRTTRAIMPTEAGLVFYDRALEVFAAVERAENSVADISGVATGALKIAAPLSLARRVIAPLVAAFHHQHPRLEIRLRASDGAVDLLAEHVDLAVRTTPLSDSTFVTRKLTQSPRVICAAPSYLAARGRPERPEDLANHNCLLLRYPGSRDFCWTIETAGRPTNFHLSGGFDSDDGDILTAWALQGEGVVLKPYWEIAEHLRSGALVRLLPDNAVAPMEINLVYPSRDLLAPKTRLFADFLIQNVKLEIEQP